MKIKHRFFTKSGTKNDTFKLAINLNYNYEFNH
jgi:hypothetical protein